MNGMDHDFSSANFPHTAHPQTGFWSPQTSAANFCEIDYEVTRYLAEFINTLSNLAYVYAAVVTLPKNQRGGFRAFRVWEWPVESLSLLLVGLGSGLFHATLLHEMQILDESGMYAITGALDYRLWSAGMGEGIKRAFGLVLGSTIVGVVGWNAFGTSDGKASNVIHLLLFVGLLSAMWPRVLWMIRQGRKKRRQEGLRGKDMVGRQIMREFQLGVFYFIFGFVLWNIDGHFCGGLRHIRAMLGIPVCWPLELHGWWHFFTALGARNFVRVARELTDANETSSKVYTNGHTNAHTNGHTNGHLKAS